MNSDISKNKKPLYRILQVFGSLGTGGAETWLISVLKELNSLQNDLPYKVEIHIFLTNGVKSDFDDYASELGAYLHYSTYSRSNIINFIREWRYVLKTYNFDVIHNHQENTSGWHFLFGINYLPNICITHLHNPILHHKIYCSSFLRKLTLYFGKLFISIFSTHILSTSNQLIEEQGYNNFIFSKQTRKELYCGFDTSIFKGDRVSIHNDLCNEFNWPENSLIILFVGRLDSNLNNHLNQKNPFFALDIAKLCADSNKFIRFLMVGDGEKIKSLLSDKVMSWGLIDKFNIIGRRSDVARLMLGSDILLFPSISEGLGMVVVEAQAAGLQSIISDVVPKECVVVDELVNFYSLNESALSWSKKLLSLVESNSFDNTISNIKVENSSFSIKKSVNNLLKIYAVII